MLLAGRVVRAEHPHGRFDEDVNGSSESGTQGRHLFTRYTAGNLSWKREMGPPTGGLTPLGGLASAGLWCCVAGTRVVCGEILLR